MSAFPLIRQVLRLFPRLWPIAKLARLEAEALVWRHGTAGVEAARQRERMGRDGSLEERLHDWLVRWLAERRHGLLRVSIPARATRSWPNGRGDPAR